MTTTVAAKSIGGATVTETVLACGCMEWRQSLPGHQDAVEYSTCTEHA